MLASVPDPRGLQGKQYPLEFILAICVVAVLAGALLVGDSGKGFITPARLSSRCTVEIGSATPRAVSLSRRASSMTIATE